MARQSEAVLETQLVRQLVGMGYEQVVLDNQDALIQNFRKQLSMFNAEVLADNLLSDSEFDRFYKTIVQGTVFDCAKTLREEKHLLIRDDGTPVYLRLFNSKEWCRNEFQVAQQITEDKVEGSFKARYDVTILINGLPLIQVELKRNSISIGQAFDQIERYRRQNYKGLFRFIQLFVISNGVETRYYANSKHDIQFAHAFNWADKDNKWINRLSEFTESFLEKCHAAKIIARYMVLQETTETILVMRPYQIAATEELVRVATETRSDGYIWHTTGSGKTLTSFKVSQILSKMPKFKKVVFLIDRGDLDSQTVEEFNRFERDAVDQTDNTRSLLKQLADPTKTLVVTTIQKLNNAVKRPTKAVTALAEERIIFIIDECHRSQFGEMHTNIKRHFTKAQYFGFTGTPIIEPNSKGKDRTTADIFGRCLHKYQIKEAIRDRNVLGFLVEYHTTVRGKVDETDPTRVPGIDRREVFESDEHIGEVVKHIIGIHDRKTQDRKYNALLAVGGTDVLRKYYDAFRSHDHDMKIAAMFSYEANEEGKGLEDERGKELAERIIQDYNQMFGTSYSVETYAAYKADVQRKIKERKLDLVIVIRMLLTGFDAKGLNTLYVDKMFDYHDLLQAYSRTNRVEKPTKQFGNILAYRNLKEKTDESLTLFSGGKNLDEVLMKPLHEHQADAKKKISELREILPDPYELQHMEGEADQAKFVKVFQQLSGIVKKMQAYVEFEHGTILPEISEQEMDEYRGVYMTIYRENQRPKGDKVSILADLDFQIELVQTDKINVDYILALIKKINLNDEREKAEQVKKIRKEIDNAANEELSLKSELLKGFLDEVVPHLTNADSVDDSYEQYEDEYREREIDRFAEAGGVSREDIEFLVSDTRLYGKYQQKDLLEIKQRNKVGLSKWRAFKQDIVSFIDRHMRMYG